MKVTDNLDDAINILSDQNSMTLIFQDWDSGIQVLKNYDGNLIKQKLSDAREKYGDRFGFRSFNEDIDVYWNGDFAVICTNEDKGESHDVPLESDTKRHSGMSNFASDLKNLRIKAKKIVSDDGGTYLRFIGIQEVRND
jgi:hypothetical protein